MFILPMGDFSALSYLPTQYKHCKETEDKDLTALDFITDHLINIDYLFDAHEKGDEQRPHKPFQYSQHFITCTFVITKKITFSPKTIVIPAKNTFGFPSASSYSFNFLTSIFRPPLA